MTELAAPAGIEAHMDPTRDAARLRDHVARHAGIENAQALLGHADVGTTQICTGAPTLDELATASRGPSEASCEAVALTVTGRRS